MKRLLSGALEGMNQSLREQTAQFQIEPGPVDVATFIKRIPAPEEPAAASIGASTAARFRQRRHDRTDRQKATICALQEENSVLKERIKSVEIFEHGILGF